MSSSRSDQMLRDEGLNVISQSLYKELYIELPNKVRDRRRWIWELMQNAKDAIEKNGHIEINLSDDAVTFAHNGLPFTYDNLAALLSQRTSKSPDYTDDQKEAFFEKVFSEDETIGESEKRRFLKTSGRFGSGFMTTYLLSKNIRLESIYTDGEKIKEFSLSLDRSVERQSDLIEKVRESFDLFAEIELFKDDDVLIDLTQSAKCWTQFIYRFEDEGSKAIANEGIQDLYASVQYVFCFVEVLSKISIFENGTQTVYSRIGCVALGDLTIVKVARRVNNEQETVLEIIKSSSKYDVVSIVLPITRSEHTYCISFPDKKTPYQFISFPLIGSESFSFPAIVNSPLFNPGDAREKVYLNLTYDLDYDKKVWMNRRLLERCLELYEKLLKCAIEERWQNLHYLARMAIPDDTDVTWYSATIQSQLIRIVTDLPMVRPHSGTNDIRVIDAKFPVYDELKINEFWELCAYLIATQIPIKADIELWKQIVIDNKECWDDTNHLFGLEDLLRLIMDCKTMDRFIADYFPDDPERAYFVLNRIISFTEIENPDLLNRSENSYWIIPSQQGTFTEKKKLRRDKGWPDKLIPNSIKDVLRTMGDNWYGKLVSDQITCFESDVKRGVKDASERVRAKAEKYLSMPVISERDMIEQEKLDEFKKAMFELIALSPQADQDHETIFNFAKRLFPESSAKELKIICDAEDFVWSYCKRWIVEICLEKVASMGDMAKLSVFLTGSEYPNNPTVIEEIDLKFKVDSFVNDLIGFAFRFNNNADHLLEKHAVIPNQNNLFLHYGVNLYNDFFRKPKANDTLIEDRVIPEPLKSLVKELGEDIKDSLLHLGISFKLPDARDTEYLCGVADKLIIDNRDSKDPTIKNAIRELDKWIAINIDEPDRGLYFGRFYEKRHSIVLNTYTSEERNDVDRILKSGQSRALAKISENVRSPETISKLAELVDKNDIGELMTMMEKFPNVTIKRIEHLLKLEELSVGLRTDVDYTPDEQQRVRNFETGYKGEAFIFKQLKEQGLNVIWTNQSMIPTMTKIIDIDGVLHYILDRGEAYDLIVKNEDGPTVYIQVKATTTDINLTDLIALPISTSEWKFLKGTSVDESFFIVRVFNIGGRPTSYYLKLTDRLV